MATAPPGHAAGPDTAHALPRPVGAFDGDEPPDWEGILDCVHCGICLPQCPTYRVLGQEMDSPRGRVYLMRAVSEGRIGLTENFVLHMDRCLGCRACETACPAGVPFGRLIEETRGQIERKVPRPLGRRILGKLLLGIFPERQRLARLLALTRLYQRSGLQRVVRGTGVLQRFPRVRAMERLLPTLPATRAERLPAETLPPSGRPRGTVAVLEGCVQSQLFPEVNRATVRLLARVGYRVVVPQEQGCCGALHLHWGDRRAARELARRNAAAFADTDWIVTNALAAARSARDTGIFRERSPRLALAAARRERIPSSSRRPRRPLDPDRDLPRLVISPTASGSGRRRALSCARFPGFARELQESDLAAAGRGLQSH